MSMLFQRFRLACPYTCARDLLAHALGPSVSSGAPEVIRLVAPLPAAGIVDIGGEVAVIFGSAVDPMHVDQPWSIRWLPNALGLYPSFEGTLTVRGDASLSSSMLELQGDHESSTGATGLMVDAIVSSRIVSATARELLHIVGADIVRQYRKNELIKRLPIQHP